MTSASLSEAYRFLRTVEHRIQVVQERQTHNLPTKDEELQALARRCGFLRDNGLERFTRDPGRASRTGFHHLRQPVSLP